MKSISPTILALLLIAACEQKQQTNRANEAPPQEAPQTAKDPVPNPAPTVTKAPIEAPKVNPSPAVVIRAVVAPPLGDLMRELARQWNTSNQSNATLEIQDGALMLGLKRLSTDGGDLIVTEGFAALDVARATGIVNSQSATILTHLPLRVTVAGRKAEQLRTLAHLDKPGIRIGIADPSNSTGGQAARRLFRRAKLGSGFTELILPLGPKNTLKDGTIDAYIGWGALPSGGVPLTLQQEHRELLPTPIAVTTMSKHPQQAKAFIDWTTSEQAQRVMVAAATVPKPTNNIGVVASVVPARLKTARRHANAVVIGDKILVVGGENSGELLSSMTWFTPRTMAIKEATVKLPTGLLGAAVVHDKGKNQILICGGQNRTGPTDTVYRYELRPERMDLLEWRLPLATSKSGVGITGDTLYMFGGIGNQNATLDAILKTDLNTGTGERQAVRLPRAMHGISVSDGPRDKMWLFGGWDTSGPTDTILQFDPETGDVRPIGQPLQQQIAYTSASTWATGWVVLGGQTAHGPTDTISTIDANGLVTPLPTHMPYPFHSAATVRYRNSIYVIGGVSSNRLENRIVRFPY